MLKYQDEKTLPVKEGETEQVDEQQLDLDNMDLLDVSALQLPKEILTLSLINNKLQNVEELIGKIQYLNLKVLWLNGNPIANNEQILEYVATKTRI